MAVSSDIYTRTYLAEVGAKKGKTRSLQHDAALRVAGYCESIANEIANEQGNGDVRLNTQHELAKYWLVQKCVAYDKHADRVADSPAKRKKYQGLGRTWTRRAGYGRIITDYDPNNNLNNHGWAFRELHGRVKRGKILNVHENSMYHHARRQLDAKERQSIHEEVIAEVKQERQGRKAAKAGSGRDWNREEWV